MSATIDCARASGKHGKLSTIEPARLRCQAAPRAQAHARQLLPCPGRQARADAGPTPAGPAGDGRSAYVGQSVDALRRLGVGREAYLDAIGRGGHVNEGRKKARRCTKPALEEKAIRKGGGGRNWGLLTPRGDAEIRRALQ